MFYTAYDKYMIYAIRGAAFDYLLKPIDKKELEGIIDRFMKKEEESAADIFGYSCACAFGRRAYLYDIHAYQ